jgi:hypothetical protein
MAKVTTTLALSVALAACSCDLGGASSRAGEQTARATSVAVAPVAVAPVAPAAGRSRRPLQDGEVSAAVLQKASEVLKEHADKPLGTEVPFELEGRRYVARVEEHFREPGSAEPGPKGEHRGVTVYAIE